MENQADKKELIVAISDWIASHISDIGFLLVALLVGALVTWLFYRKALIRKQISYQLKDFRLLGYEKQSLPDDIEIRFRRIPVQKLNRVVLILWNSGRETINGTDIVDSDKLRLSFRNAKILDAKIINTSRTTIGAVINTPDNGSYDPKLLQDVLLNFDFLDRSDGITMEILYAPQENNKPKATLYENSHNIGADFENKTEDSTSNENGHRKSKIPCLFGLQGTIKGIPEGSRQLQWNPNPDFSNHFAAPTFGSIATLLFSYIFAAGAISKYQEKEFVISTIAGLLSFGLIIVFVLSLRLLYTTIRDRPPKKLRTT